MFTISVISYLEGRILVLIVHAYGLVFSRLEGRILVLIVHIYDPSYFPFRGQDFGCTRLRSRYFPFRGKDFGSDKTC